MTNDSVNVRFGMMVIYARDLQRSIEFYRLLGLAVPDPRPDRPVALYRMGNGVTLIFTTGAVAERFDADWVRPGPGYQQVMEFLVDDDAAVDAVWARLTSAGHHGRTAPGHLIGPYATMVDDPDGNVVLISHDPVTNAAAASPA
ncbi:MAG: VOC family protein [Actinobacteria bacterium]|nr:VOC family protein [Actinomycetota bacterium]